MPSHHSSSSHGSRSRSSSSSFRSSSSRSSSSRSSYSSRSSSRSSSGGGPSGHSSSSHSSRPLFGGASAPARRPAPQPVSRPRVNQPVGFLISQSLRPTTYYGRRHDYVYYPASWTDPESGRFYEKGYYDENGTFYDSVAFQKDGRYENVVCRCPYCDSRIVSNLNNSAGSAQTLECPNCGAPMEIQSELDEITRQGAENTHVYNAEESLRGAFGQGQKQRRSRLPLALILVALLLLSRSAGKLFRAPEGPAGQNTPIQQISVVDQNSRAEYLYLKRQSDGSYHRVTDPIRADRILPYDADADSYYDEGSDCWVWYNTEVDPPVWQYWVEGISSDFGDYGWMEHDDEGWWIEESAGNWISLPGRYPSDSLWYIG